MIRGNHEDPTINGIYGFRDECRRRLHEDLFRCVDPPLAYPWESGNHTKRQFLWGGVTGLPVHLLRRESMQLSSKSKELRVESEE